MEAGEVNEAEEGAEAIIGPQGPITLGVSANINYLWVNNWKRGDEFISFLCISSTSRQNIKFDTIGLGSVVLSCYIATVILLS